MQLCFKWYNIKRDNVGCYMAGTSFLMHTISTFGIILFSKLIGFIREMIMAGVYGAGALTDAYNSAYSLFYIPVLLFTSCLTSTFQVFYNKSRAELGLDGAKRFSNSVISLFALFALAVSGIMFAFAEGIVKNVFAGFSNEKVQAATEYLRIMLPSLIFFTVAIIYNELFNADKRFIAAQLSGLPLSFTLILTVLLFSGGAGLRAQAWGVAAAGVIQVIISALLIRRSYVFKPSLKIFDPRIRRLLAASVPAVLSMAVTELNHIIDRSLASGLNSGDITAMTYAFKLVSVFIGIGVVPLTTVSFASMAKEAAKKGSDGVRDYTDASLRLLLAVLLPAALLCAVSSGDIIRFAYGRGAFTESNIAVTAGVFLFYILGLPFFGMRDLLSRTMHSLENTRIPMYAAMISMSVNIGLNLWLRTVMGVNGLAFSTVIAALVNVLLLGISVSKRVKNIFNRAFIIEGIKTLVSAIVMLACALVLSSVLPKASSCLGALIRFGATALICFAVYTGVCFALRVKAYTELMLYVFSKFKRLIKH